MVDELCQIINAYDRMSSKFDALKIDQPDLDERKFQRIREFAFFIRDWLGINS